MQEIKNSHIPVLFGGSTHKCSVPKYSCYSRVLSYSHLNSGARADKAESKLIKMNKSSQLYILESLNLKHSNSTFPAKYNTHKIWLVIFPKLITGEIQ